MTPCIIVPGLLHPAPAVFAWAVADYCNFDGPVLMSGGNADEPDPNYGPFMLNTDDASNSDPFYGARHLVSKSGAVLPHRSVEILPERTGFSRFLSNNLEANKEVRLCRRK